MIHPVVLLLWLVSFAAAAHESRPAYVEVEEGDAGQYSLTFRQPESVANPSWLLVQTNCKQLSERLTTRTATSITQTWREDCSAETEVSLSVGGMEQGLIDVLVRFTAVEGSSQTFMLAPDNPTVVLTGAATPRLPAYFVLGVEHLLLGYDHVLFVIGLMLLITGGWRLVQTITSFTIAHSITLALSTLDLLRISPAPVEAAIALSILYVAVEIVKPDDEASLTRRFPWLIAFAFGLLHGLGFAGVLREIGLPEEQVGLALLLFNLGIEAGQLMIVALVLVITAVLRVLAPQLRANGTSALYLVPAYAIGGIATFWLVERVTTIVSQAS